MSDALRVIGGLNIRYADIVFDRRTDNRSSEEIISDIKSKLRELSEE